LLGRNQEAIETAQAVLNFAPDFPSGLEAMFSLRIIAGNCDAVESIGNHMVDVLGKKTNTTSVYMDLCQSTDPEARARAIETMLTWPSLELASVDSPTLSAPENMVEILVELGEFEAALIVTTKYIDYYAGFVLQVIRSKHTVNGIKLYCDPRVQLLFEASAIPPINGESTCN
jgi:hypothetical protein